MVWACGGKQYFSDVPTGIKTVVFESEEYYKELSMPTSIREFGIKEEELETLAEMCCYRHTRKLPGYKELDYDDLLKIYRMSWELGA